MYTLHTIAKTDVLFLSDYFLVWGNPDAEQCYWLFTPYQKTVIYQIAFCAIIYNQRANSKHTVVSFVFCDLKFGICDPFRKYTYEPGICPPQSLSNLPSFCTTPPLTYHSSVNYWQKKSICCTLIHLLNVYFSNIQEYCCGSRNFGLIKASLYTPISSKSKFLKGADS